ncbi:hypothetical protein J1N35_028638 [Gossypium stocksii]|uniref:Pentacotripeptide-repeat region of PRORP domain-containing protein n=1 Tax=Gossypium stocksii TaxID=47602 RepID=A0A9D3ZRB3_9ROSI|nr:hypothetical protein J1N35_028638 [Gossypium stocksii]
MGKLPSSLILRSVVNGGSHLSNFHFFSSSSNTIATHFKALSKKPMPVIGKGRIDFGFSVLGKMLKLGVEPSAVTFSTLINGLCNQSKISEAVSIFDEMTERGYQPDLIVYSSILKGLCKSVNTDRAVRYTILIDALCKEGMISKAVETIDMMRKQGIEPNVVTYDALVNGHCLQNEMDKARRVLQLMIEKGCAPNIVTYSTMISGYCKSKRLDEAMELFHEISQKGPIPNIVTYNNLMQTYPQLATVPVPSFQRMLSAAGGVSSMLGQTHWLSGQCDVSSIAYPKELELCVLAIYSA